MEPSHLAKFEVTVTNKKSSQIMERVELQIG